MTCLSRWLGGGLATAEAMFGRWGRRTTGRFGLGSLVSSVGLLVYLAPSVSLAQTGADARTIASIPRTSPFEEFESLDYDAGPTAAIATGSKYAAIPAWNSWSSDAAAFVNGAVPSHFLSSRVQTFTEVGDPQRGYAYGLAESAWRDVIRVSPPSGQPQPSSIVVRVRVDATVQFDRIGSPSSTGRAGIELLLAPNLYYPLAPYGWISEPVQVVFLKQLGWFRAIYESSYDVTQQVVADPLNLVNNFSYERSVTLNYDPALDGYPFSALLRTSSLANGMDVLIADSASILSVTDGGGFDLTGGGYGLSTESGMDLVQNSAPLANAGEDQILECTSPAGALVQLDGTGSSDPDGDSLTYQWTAVGIEFDDATSATPIAFFPLGSTTVTLVVTDEFGAIGTADVIVTVEDSVAPEITAVVTSQNAIWPPNHQMVPVEVAVLLRDDCTDAQFLQVSGSARSNERDDFDGDGTYTGDVNYSDGFSAPVPFQLTYDPIAGVFRGTLLLRAERNDSPDGRKYSITIHAADAFGNAGVSTAIVVVPKNQAKGKK